MPESLKIIQQTKHVQFRIKVQLKVEIRNWICGWIKSRLRELRRITRKIFQFGKTQKYDTFFSWIFIALSSLNSWSNLYPIHCAKKTYTGMCSKILAIQLNYLCFTLQRPSLNTICTASFIIIYVLEFYSQDYIMSFFLKYLTKNLNPWFRQIPCFG